MGKALLTEFTLIKDYFINSNIKSIIDLIIVFLIVLKLIDFLAKTRAVHAVKGIIVIYLAQFISEIIGLNILNEFLGYTTTLLWVSLVFIFNKEFRMLLENIGRFKTSDTLQVDESLYCIRTISRAVDELSKKKIGSLMVIENDARLEDYIETGHKLDANLTEELIMMIFENHSRFHDGAIIIRNTNIVAAKCFLPLSKNMNKKVTYGTRHRAATGITEISDAITIITSEETGRISIASKGILYPLNDSDEIIEKYTELARQNNIKEQVKKFNFRDFFKRK